MKNVIMFVALVFALLTLAPTAQASSDEERKEYFGFKVDLGGTYALAPNVEEDGHQDLFGFEVAAGVYAQAPGIFRGEVDFAFYNGVFGNEHISRFGIFRYGLGSPNFLVHFSAASMAVVEKGVSWAPGIGLKLLAGPFYARPEFVGYVGEKMGVGFTSSVGFSL